MRLPAPDPLSIILIYLSAIVMALREALAPGTPLAKAAPSLTMSGLWSYLPLVLVSIAAVVWIVRGLGKPSVPPQVPHHPAAPPAMGPQVPQERTPKWWDKLEGFQIYLLVYMGLYFAYLTITAIFAGNR